MKLLTAILGFVLMTALPAFVLANPVHKPNTPCGGSCTLQITQYANDKRDTDFIFRVSDVSVTSSTTKVPYYDLYSPTKTLVDDCATQLKALPQANKMVVIKASEYKLHNSNRVVFKFNEACTTKTRPRPKVIGPGTKLKQGALKNKIAPGKLKKGK